MLKKMVLSLAAVLFLTATMLPADRAVAAEDKKLKVAFALLWTIDDQGWTTSHYHGIQKLEEKLGDKIAISYTEKVWAADAERVFRNYAEQGYDIIFGTTFEHMDPLLSVAKEYPEIKFEHCSGFKSAPNMRNYVPGRISGRLYGWTHGIQKGWYRGHPTHSRADPRYQCLHHRSEKGPR